MRRKIPLLKIRNCAFPGKLNIEIENKYFNKQYEPKSINNLYKYKLILKVINYSLSVKNNTAS